jgi:hypothetical protein
MSVTLEGFHGFALSLRNQVSISSSDQMQLSTHGPLSNISNRDPRYTIHPLASKSYQHQSTSSPITARCDAYTCRSSFRSFTYWITVVIIT